MIENIDAILKLKRIWNGFQSAHPGVSGFIGAVGKREMVQGTVIDIAFTYPDGTKLETNMKVSEEDLELFEALATLANEQR